MLKVVVDRPSLGLPRDESALAQALRLAVRVARGVDRDILAGRRVSGRRLRVWDAVDCLRARGGFHSR